MTKIVGEKKHCALLAAVQTMSRVFWGPDDQLCDSIRTGAFLSPFEALSPWIIFAPPDVLDQIRDQIRERIGRHTDVSSFCADLEADYVRLFINARDGIVAPLYQSCYEYDNAPLMGASASAMQRRFESKGLALAGEMNEPPDHLAIELEYLYFLLKAGRDQGNQTFPDEAPSFATNIMMPWLTQFSKRLSDKGTTTCFYSLVTALLLSILQAVGAEENPATL